MLVVDDHPTNRLFLLRQFEAWGAKPVVVASANEALALITPDPAFDLVLLDMQMPDMAGDELATEIRKRLGDRTPPLILLSSLGRRDAADDLFDAALLKPIKASRLFDTILDLTVAPDKLVAEPAPVAGPTMAERHPLRILIAEDNGVNQRVAALMLGKLG
ncbi:MAG: response regulator [Acidimicrobiia bacterium]